MMKSTETSGLLSEIGVIVKRLTFHAFIYRLIVSVRAAFWSLGRLDKQNCVRL